jgi:hypothetical protein
LVEFEKTHDIKAVEGELGEIRANGNAWERAAARREVVGLMKALEAEILRTE